MCKDEIFIVREDTSCFRVAVEKKGVLGSYRIYEETGESDVGVCVRKLWRVDFRIGKSHTEFYLSLDEQYR